MITIDATALTLDLFHLSGIGQFETRVPQVLALAPGTYRFGTLFGPTFEFSVTAAGTVDFAPGLAFLSGAGKTTLKVNGCRIEVDATALTFDQFSLSDTASGLVRFFPTTSVQALTLIPGPYRFGTLFGPTFEFSVTGGCTLNFAPELSFLSGAGTTTLEVIGFLLSVDARRLTLPSFTLNDSASGLGEPFPTASHQCVTLIPGPYVFVCGFSFPFSVTSTGLFDYDPTFIRCVTGLGRQQLRVSCDPTGP
jgi:hypothetical protein